HVILNALGEAEGVHYVERTTHAHRQARAKIVVLAAGALESTRILLNSRSSRFPEGLGNSSGQLGHYLMDHFTLEGAGGLLPQFKSSRREAHGTPCGFLIPKYANTDGHLNKTFLRGYRFDGDGSQELYAHAFGLAGFGSDWRRKVRSEIPYYFAIVAQGECLPRYDNYVMLDAEKKDAWGIPALRIVASYGEHEYAMAKAMRNDVMESLEVMKLQDAQPPGERPSVFGKSVQECGPARIGTDPKKSVVNGFGQLHDMKNVFVTDGAVFVTQGCYEPTLTIMAISARAGDYIVDEYRRGNV